MSGNENARSVIKKHSTFFVLGLIGLLLLEIQIFAIAVTKSGRKGVIQVSDPAGNVLYEADGTALSQFDRHYFESAFGPLEKHTTRLVTRTDPFPFRAWFFAAVGLPIGATLLVAFCYKAVMMIFFGLGKPRPEEDPTPDASTLEKILNPIARVNIFVLAGLVFLAVFCLWAVPNLLTYLGRTSLAFVSEYKWVFIAFFAVLTSLLIYVIYLRYLLARRAIEAKMEVEKYRITIAYKNGVDVAATEITAKPAGPAISDAKPATGLPDSDRALLPDASREGEDGRS
ncbi:MAG: hypothetical protein AB1921_00120 [Thermodesulfobacteriota bacterium]